ncbi:probable cytochrome P450 313a1 [Cydia splendana]|uniref:probable cytochrome P450 313a1 n=1 Tax=Cydia splendana TaxID=1100963 RepID=UPI00300C3AB2
MAINETWLREGEEGRAPVVPNYSLRHVPRPRSVRERGGGVGFYIRKANGVTLRPGMAMFLHLWATHRNTKYWGDDVEEFRPERFLEGPLKHPAQFVAFSYSLRNCIGGNYAIMSTKTNLSNLLRRYEMLPPLSVPPDQLLAPFRVKFDVMMKHCDNFELRIRSRHNGQGKK